MRLWTRVLFAAIMPVLAAAGFLALHPDVPRGMVLETAIVGTFLGLGLGGRLLLSLTRTVTHLRELDAGIQGEGAGKASGVRLDDLVEIGAVCARMAGNVRDVVAQARERQRETEAVLTHMADGILVVDADLRIRRANPAAVGLLALRPERAVGHSVIEATMHHGLDSLVRGTLATGQTQSSRLETIQPQPRLLQALVTPLQIAPDARGAVVVLQDLTEWHRLERTRRDFVSNVSHELRTPVTSIQIMVESLQRGAVQQPELRDEFLQAIGDAAHRLVRLTDDVLMLARIEAGPARVAWQPVRLDALARDVVHAHRHLAESCQVELVLEAPDPVG